MCQVVSWGDRGQYGHKEMSLGVWSFTEPSTEAELHVSTCFVSIGTITSSSNKNKPPVSSLPHPPRTPGPFDRSVLLELGARDSSCDVDLETSNQHLPDMRRLATQRLKNNFN